MLAGRERARKPHIDAPDGNLPRIAATGHFSVNLISLTAGKFVRQATAAMLPWFGKRVMSTAEAAPTALRRPGKLIFGLVLASFFSASAAQADVTGTNARIWANGSVAYNYVPVGPGLEFILDGIGVENQLLDIDPVGKKITITTRNEAQWLVGLASIDIEFSGGVLTQILSVSGPTGTAPDKGAYSASVSAKTITINLPMVENSDGTVVFSFTSAPSGAATPPSITAQPVASSINEGDDTAFSVTASNATGYQWQVNTGAAFVDIADSGNYSGATTATLSVDNATTAMDGYKYRVIVTGDATPNATSDEVALNVLPLSPAVSSVAVPATGTYGIGGDLDFTVKFDSAVTVTGTPQVELTIGSNIRRASYVSGSGTTDLTFRYSLVEGDLTSGDIAIGALFLGGGTIRNGSTDAVLTLNSKAATTGIVVDGVRPTVTSIVLSGSPAPDAATLDFIVTFDEPVTGVDPSVFTLTSSGLVPTITGVSPTGATATVTVAIPSGMGTVRLDVSSNTAIADAAGNTLSAGYTSGVTHTVQQVPGAPTMDGATGGDGQATISFTAPGSNGGAPITDYTVTSNPPGYTAAGANSPITVAGLVNGTAYTFTVTAANDVGTGPASVASNAVTPQGVQTIAFINPGAQTYGSAPTLTATATSGLPVTFASSTPGICTIAGIGTLTFVSAGTCTIDVNQAGDAAYLAATTVSQSFAVQAVVPDAPTIGTATSGNREATISFTAPASEGGAPITLYAVTSDPGNVVATGVTSPITMTNLNNGTAYTFMVHAINSAGPGPQSGASNAVTPLAPSFSFSPADGPLATGTAGVAYTGTISATGGVVPYTYATTGTLPIGLVLAADGTWSGTPTQEGTFSFTVTATDGNADVGTATYTLVIDPAALPIFTVSPAGGALTPGVVGTEYVLGLYTTPWPANYTATVISGALPPGVTLFDTPTGTIPNLYGTPTTAGSYTFTIEFTDAGAQTVQGNYALEISPVPAFVFTPAVGPLTAGTAGVAYTGSISAAGGTAPYTYTVSTGTLPAGLTLNPDGTWSGSPSVAGSFNFTVAATDGASPANTSSAVYALQIDPAPTPTFIFAPVSGPLTTGTAGVAYTGTISASGGTAPYTYAVSTGTLPAGLTLNPDGTWSGTPSVAGSFNFTVTATDGASPANTGTATYALVIAPAPVPIFTFSPAGGPLTAGTAGVVYAGTVSASGGTAPYTYAVSTGTLPAGLTVNPDGTWSGTPSVAGSFNFVITATDANNDTATASYTLVIAPAPTAPIAVFVPAAGALPAAMVDEHYSETFSVPGGSNYQISGDTLPGLTLGTDGKLAGTPAAGSEGHYRFTVTASVGGAPVSAGYDLTINPNVVTAADKLVPILPGATPLPVDLTAGATGGPFTDAILGTVTPPQAGTAEIIMGDVASIDTVWSDKFYLKFHPNPAYSGTVLVGYTLIGAGGASSSATVTFTASLDPNAVANNFDHLVKGFVQTRASLLANGVNTPGLRQRRMMSSGMRPGVVNVSPSDSSVSMNFASSLAELRSWGEAGDAADALAETGPADQPFNFWIDGTATLHLRTDDGDDHWGKFALVSVGGDYLVNDKLLLGLAFHADFMDDLTDTTSVEGSGIFIGPYVSAEIVDGVFLDASVYYGHSWNELTTSIFNGSFETERLLAKASLTGEWALSEALTLRPRANVFYLHESAGQYTVTDGLGSALTIAGFTTDQLRLSVGGTLEYTMDLGEGLTITPYIGAQLGVSLTTDNPAGGFATLSTGFDLLGLGNWTLGGAIEADLESDSLRSVSAKASLRAGF